MYRCLFSSNQVSIGAQNKLCSIFSKFFFIIFSSRKIFFFCVFLILSYDFVIMWTGWLSRLFWRSKNHRKSESCPLHVKLFTPCTVPTNLISMKFLNQMLQVGTYIEDFKFSWLIVKTRAMYFAFFLISFSKMCCHASICL